MDNEHLNELWEGRKKTASPVRHYVDGRGVDRDIMTIQLDGKRNQVFERKPNTTVWDEMR